MNKLFYKIYHGNLSFSAIEEENLPEVIDKTYFPLLELVQNNNLKVGLELSAYSLEKILELRPFWIKKFKKLYEEGLIELIGSGYIQLIGPLVPYEINYENQKIGLEVYQNILGIKPKIAYINEQVFSSSMVDVYEEAGYIAIVMEWNNAYSLHPEGEWDKTYSHQPVIVKGIESSLPIIWTDTIVFQQFQRMAHSEMSLEEYITIIKHHLNSGYKALSIYSSDLEVFNYRPGRFETEAIIKEDEWKCISKAMNNLKSLGEFALPSEVLRKTLDDKVALVLSSSTTPVLVKKQNKYSLSRWSACGRGANYINTLCFKFLKNVKTNIDKKQLLKYWGSDYRTHITEKKWENALNYLKSKIICINEKSSKLDISSDLKLKEDNNKLILEKDNYKIVFNKLKGMSLSRVYKNNQSLNFGSVKHGDLDYISHGADFYTGTTTIESAQTRKIADLNNVKDFTLEKIDNNLYKLSSIIYMKEIAIEYKNWIIDFNKNEITLDIKLKMNEFVKGSIRLGTFTLLPQNKNSKFWYECKNGGKNYERYYINEKTNIRHYQAKSLIQSSSGGLGVTDGIIRFGINDTIISEIKINREVSYPFIMLQNSNDHEKHLTRVYFSVQEFDDTLKEAFQEEFRIQYQIKL
ncbi:hypothetical protein [Arcobacter sp. LA11]|uniref:hypothetical protein n=1 Tax=Arcobacter sp. LA11 TaxID=1898176 RepID=UPI000934DE2B|nr:hypothetical protein [Arcobacter sp. LA11]